MNDKEEQQARLLSLLGPKIYARAVFYYKRRAILQPKHQSQSPDTFEALIRGSESRPYTTRVSFNEKNEIIDAQCSCPYPGYCKHIGALALFLYENLLYKDSYQKNAENETTQQTKTFENNHFTDFSKQKNIYTKEITFAWDNIQPDSNTDKDLLPQKTAGKFSLVFALSWDIFENDWYIRAAAQYIKKDGSLGRIEKYKEEKISKPIEWQKKILLDSITTQFDAYSRNHFVNSPLVKQLNLLDQLDNIPLYFEDDRNALIKLHKFSTKKITLQFAAKKQLNDQIFFDGFLRIFVPASVRKKTEKKHLSYIYLYDPKKIVYLSNKAFFIDTQNGFLIDFQATIQDIHFLETIFSVNHFFHYANIESFKKNAEQQKIKSIVIDFDFQGVWHYYPEPSLILELHKYFPIYINKTNYSTERIAYYFKYKTNISDQSSEKEMEVSRNEKDYILHLPNIKGNAIHLIHRDKNKETDLINFFQSLLAKSTAVIQYDKRKSSNRAISQEWSLDTQEFLMLFAYDLLNNNIQIRIDKTPVARQAKINIIVSSGIDWLDIHAQADENRLKKYLFNWQDIEKGFLRDNNQFIFLSQQDIKKLQKLRHWGMNEKGQMKVSKHNIGLLSDISEDIDNPDQEDIAHAKKFLSKLKKFREIKQLSPPKSFQGSMRPYQREGYQWLHFLYEYQLNGILADDMGLGKTVQTIALLTKLFEQKKISNVLIVVPVSTMANWKNEWHTFAPGISVYQHQGIKRYDKIKKITKNQVTLVSYHTLRNDLELFQQKEFDYLIMDESQNIKNPTSQIHRAIREVSAKHKLSLTGTPLENNTMDIWAQMQVLHPGILGTQKEFKNRFTNPIEVNQNHETSAMLRQMIYPFLLRRKKEDVLKDLPPKEEIVYYCDMTPKQHEVYNQHAAYFQAKLLNMIDTDVPKGTKAMEILHALLRMRQISIFPELADKRFKNIPSAKFDAFKDLLADIIDGGHKVLIFSQFVQVLSILQEYLNKEKIKYSYIDGQTRNRQKQIDNFQKKKDIQVFLLSLKAGGVGINLTAADYVVLFDPWWNPAVESQAIDRSHRIGQKQKVLAYRLITKDTIEEKVLELQQKKKGLIEDIITEESNIFKSLTKDDIRHLFS